MSSNVPHLRPPRKCTPRAEERASKTELEDALRRANLAGHRQLSFAAYVIGVAVSTLHGWRNPLALDRLPTRQAIDRLDHFSEMRGNLVLLRRVAG